MKEFRLILSLTILLTSCGRTHEDKFSNNSPSNNTGLSSVCSQDKKIIGSWQGISRNEVLIFNKDCTVKSLFCGMSGFFKVRVYEFNKWNDVIIQNYYEQTESTCYKKGERNYRYRFNTYGNLIIEYDQNAYEFTRLDS